MTKKCSFCKKELNIESFHKRKKSPDGLRPRCIPCQTEYDHDYYLCHKEERIEDAKKYANSHKEERRIWYRIYSKEKRKNDPSYRLIRNYRKRTNDALRGCAKPQTTMELLGCDSEALWKHLEAQFQPGMSRENYGKWHVDHIKPCSSFDMNDAEQVKQCFHYTNLQPLWALDNLKKADVY